MTAIIKYNAGNTASVKNALNRLGCESIITDNREALLAADRVIFPGVGEASSAMYYLRNKGLHILIPELKQPVLGVCLGLQLMCATSEEGDTQCLGIFDTRVRLFPPDDIVPHIGWNNPTNMKSMLFDGVEPDSDFYFVHSYYAEICPETIAVCDYIIPFAAAINKGNFYATQFHPEKSASAGEKILKNFLQTL
ncbi:MAG: imidazole glycerol phosphate synthase subunit HisH [Prevotellaceae bacterium]|jgi:glutamine amidotransferase|nr:imidazole glycerol phosphate synthase subunit HisH [Prevotellaceae bacterium]